MCRFIVSRTVGLSAAFFALKESDSSPNLQPIGLMPMQHIYYGDDEGILYLLEYIFFLSIIFRHIFKQIISDKFF
jgi:hypothetical protein